MLLNMLKQHQNRVGATVGVVTAGLALNEWNKGRVKELEGLEKYYIQELAESANKPKPKQQTPKLRF